MGWRVTVKAGKVRDMKNKRKMGRKTGKSGKKRWVGGVLTEEQNKKYKCFPNPTPDLLCNYDKEHNRYQDIGPFLVNDVLNRHIASYVPVSYLSDQNKVAELTAWNTDLNKYINCGNYDMTNPSKLPYDLNNYQIQPGDFILSEAPISNKFYDFWDIVITMKIDVIVMLTNLIEKGIIKAAKYFPDGTTTKLEFGTISVVLTNYRADTNKIGNTLFEISTFTVRKDNVSHTVTHLWYKAWPDQGVVTLDAFNTLIQKYYDHTNDASKTLVHCSAGVGRTGTFVAALLYCRFQKKINIDNIILFLRKCRMWQVQNTEQYALLIENQIKILKRPNVAAAARPIVAATESSGISATPVAHSNQHAALQVQLHPSSPPEPTKSDNNYVTDPAYLAYAAPKDADVSYSNDRYNFIFRLPVFLYPKTQDPDEYRNLSEQILTGRTNRYILRPCSDQNMSHFIITYTNDNGNKFYHTKILIVNRYLKLEDPWNPVVPGTNTLKPKPQHYDDLFPDLGGILKQFFHKDIKPLKIYNEPYTDTQSLYLGLMPPQSSSPVIPISPAEAEVIRLQEEMQLGPVPTQPPEEAIDVARPAGAARPIVAATESSGISASAAATRPAAVEGVAQPASTVAAVAANFTSITKTDLPPELRKYYHDDDLSTLYTKIDTFIQNHPNTFFFYIRNSRKSNKLAISFHDTNLLTHLHKSYYISKDTQSNKFILQNASTHNKVDTLPEEFRLYIGLQSDFTLDNPANSKNALSIFVHDTTQPAAVEGVAQPAAVDAASVQPTPLTSLESAVQSVIKNNSGINVTSQLVQSRSPEQAIAATAGVDQPTTAPPVTTSAQGTTSAVVPAPAIATAETSSPIPSVADNPNPTASRGISSADDDRKEGPNTLPASGVIPSIYNLSSDQPTEVATAAASNTAPTTTPITAPVVNTTVSTTVVAAPNTTLTIAPTGTIPESLHTSVAVIQQTTYDPTTKSTIRIFDNGTRITTKKSNTNSHVFECTISSQT